VPIQPPPAFELAAVFGPPSAAHNRVCVLVVRPFSAVSLIQQDSPFCFFFLGLIFFSTPSLSFAFDTIFFLQSTTASHFLTRERPVVFLREKPPFIECLWIQKHKCLQAVKETKLVYLTHNK
jgi:hypothetical protein